MQNYSFENVFLSKYVIAYIAYVSQKKSHFIITEFGGQPAADILCATTFDYPEEAENVARSLMSQFKGTFFIERIEKVFVTTVKEVTPSISYEEALKKLMLKHHQELQDLNYEYNMHPPMEEL